MLEDKVGSRVRRGHPFVLQAPRSGRVVQVLHAGLILILPAVAALLCLVEALRGEVRGWEVALALGLYVVTMLGITVGYHRHFSHRAFRTHNWISALLAILGSMAAQGPVIYWVSNHRRHHRFVESDLDPHSPHHKPTGPHSGLRGFLHAHILWTFSHEITNSSHFARDLLADRVLSFVSRTYYFWVVLGLIIPTIIGAAIEGSWAGAWSGFLWGGGLRLFISYHLTNSINSVTHSFGYRSFETADHSRNNLLLGLPTLGEAWHNNHHAAPHSAMFGRKWWEVDIGGLTIKLLSGLGCAWDVRQARKTPSSDAGEMDDADGTAREPRAR